MKNVMKPISSHIIRAASRSREHKLPQLCGNSVVQRYFPTYFWTAQVQAVSLLCLPHPALLAAIRFFSLLITFFTSSESPACCLSMETS
uniref:Uncharacterized protein n=1 Tax=Anguilla anguilla TaxID=7936 RepID=A0A0E9TN94_ANGAN